MTSTPPPVYRACVVPVHRRAFSSLLRPVLRAAVLRPGLRPAVLRGAVLRGAVLRAAVLLLVALGTPGGPAATFAAEPTGSMTYTALPAHHGEPGLPRGHFVHTMDAGSRIDDAVLVFNLTPRPATFELSSADLVERADGGRSPAGAGVDATEAGSWITWSVASITVPPHGTERVPFTITVPEDVASGAYPAAILIERQQPAGDAAITLRGRLALPVLLDVVGPEVLGVQLGATLGPLGWQREPGAVRFALPVTNTGDVTFVADAIVIAVNRRELPLAEVSLTPLRRAVAPGGTAELDALWDSPPRLARITAHAEVVATAGDRPPMRFTSEPVIFWLIPWSDLLLAVGLVLLLIIALARTRERRQRWRQQRHEERDLVRRFRAQRRATDRAGPRSRPASQPPATPVGG